MCTNLKMQKKNFKEMFWNEYKNMVHGSLVKRIPKGYLYKYTIVFIVEQYFFKFEIFGLDLYLLTSNIAFETLQNGA